MEQAHERITQWIKDGPEVLARLRDDYVRAKAAFEEIQEQCARLRQERSALQADNEWLTKTQSDLVDTITAGLDLAGEGLRQFRKAREARLGAPTRAQNPATPAVPAIQGDILKAAPSTASSTVARPTIKPREAGGPTLRRVLIVDDDAEFRSLLSDHLGDKPWCETRSAASGEEALMLLPSFQPQMVLLDVTMPGMGGMEALRRIKARYPAVRVMMVTGLEDRGLAQEALVLGASDYLKKPFELGYLDAFLEIYLNEDQAPTGAQPSAEAPRNSGSAPAKTSIAQTQPAKVPGPRAGA